MKKIYQFLLPIYTLILLYLMFIGFGRNPFPFNIVRLVPLKSTFHFVKESLFWRDVVINIAGNLIMFIPYGFLGWIFPKLNQLKSLIINFLGTIIIIETLQYFTRLGVFDIDDVLLNTFGVYVGYILYKKFFMGKIK